MDVCIFKKIGPPKKRYCNDFFLDEMVDWAEMEVEKPKGVENSTSNIDKGIDVTDGVESMTKCLPYYALENGFCLSYKRSGKYRVVAMYGQRKPRLSNLKKGKQRKQTRSYGKEILDSNPGSTVKLGVIVNLDGKTYFDRPNQGEILTVIGRDVNNHIYPVAWAVVNVENKDNWTWFLEFLEQNLGSTKGNRLTLMSDQHKGLMEAIKEVMPNAEHRQCARHIYENFKKQYPRHKPLLTMLEAIRVIVLERMNKIREISRKWNPRHVIPAGGNLFEVRSGSEGFTVDEGKRTCSYRMWLLLRIPCVHATKRGPVRDEGAGGSRRGSSGSRGGVSSSGGASGLRGRGAGGSGGASRSRGRGDDKRKHVSTARTQKIQGKKNVGTSGFAKWFELQYEPGRLKMNHNRLNMNHADTR
uniref:MULE transposase domain-containing protein n=1 Tax=Tanacetum cinerariifolium TaxID=118510 RepID=A0A6L2JBW5_TANCI|nr:hypothetical protein [Tanacetum cinerariifolium]